MDIIHGTCVGKHRLYISTFPPLVDRIGEENKIYPARYSYYIGWGQTTGDIPIIVSIDISVDITIDITVYITTSDIQTQRNKGTKEQRNKGTTEQWNIGTKEQRN